MSSKNRFAELRDFLKEFQNDIGNKCAVSASYTPEGFAFVISFHENDELNEKEIIKVDFEESDFQDSKVYEESLISQIKDYADEYIKNNN